MNHRTMPKRDQLSIDFQGEGIEIEQVDAYDGSVSVIYLDLDQIETTIQWLKELHQEGKANAR